LNISRNKSKTSGAKGVSSKEDFLKDMSANVDDLGESDFELGHGFDPDAEKRGGDEDLGKLFGEKKKKPEPSLAEGNSDPKLGPFDSMLETLSTIDKAASDKTLKDKVIKLKALLAKDEAVLSSTSLHLQKGKDKHEFQQCATALQKIQGLAKTLTGLINGKKANKETVKKYMFDGIKLVKANKDLKISLNRYCKNNFAD
jgi:hypothetical protein